MGHGVAVQCALTNQNVTLIDHLQRNLDSARDRIREAVALLSAEGLTDRPAADVVERIGFTLEANAGVEAADIVIETIAEDLAAKRQLFKTVAASAPSDTVLASSTSSIPITSIADGLTAYADRIVGCHWWYSPYLLTPVGIVHGEQTSDETVDRIRVFVETVDRDPILVERDVHGFVCNRIQFAVVRECLHLVDEGVASVDDINRAVRDGYATRTAAIGSFETMGIAGLDLFATIAENLYPELAADTEDQAELTSHVDEGRTGIEVGAGFFAYDEPEAVTRQRDRTIAAIRRALENVRG